jgi:bisphosphoglycerate-dependent phosphoglycerate mutase
MEVYAQGGVAQARQSEWNSKPLYGGRMLVLPEQGVFEAMRSGRQLLEAGFQWTACSPPCWSGPFAPQAGAGEMKQEWVPVINDWRLNERHYVPCRG